MEGRPDLNLARWTPQNSQDYIKLAKTDQYLMYTDQEYNANLVNETWTREDTDLLLKTAEKYSERWPIVHDNWLQDSRTVNVIFCLHVGSYSKICKRASRHIKCKRTFKIRN